ncbi:MAG: hypothetical protein COA79_18825 [Planctomycetota bacterium]|nr:MAG: hypothetical protein COA79_18825 [Planctomycetota bacterium]
MLSNRLFTFILFLLISFSIVSAETIKIKINKDSSLSYHPKERNNKQGKSTGIKLKYFEEFGILDADVSSLKGKIIKSAYLFVKARGGHQLNLNQGTDLKWLAISSVSSEWDEANVCGNNNGLSKNWGWPGAKMYDVVLGNGNTLRDNNILEPTNGWHKVKLNNDLISAMVAKASHGLFLADGSGHFRINCKIFTHEQGSSSPYLSITVSGENNAAPSSISDASAMAANNSAGKNYGALRIKFKAPKDAFSYNILLNDKKVARWQIPFAKKADEQESFVLKDLVPNQAVTIKITAVSKQGLVSATTTITGKVSPKLTPPTLPDVTFIPKAGAPKKVDGVSVYAFPEIAKVNPISGSMLYEGIADFKEKNVVWDGSSSTVRIASARAEIISFQLGFDGAFKGLSIKVSDLSGPSRVSNKGVKIWRNWYVGKFSEYALPFKGSLDCPMADNKIKGQTHQAVTIDYFIPKETRAGNYKAKITLSLNGKTLVLPLKVKVYNSVIPDEIHFNPELNCYGGPGTAGSPQFNNSYKLAHYHRTTINRVPYSQGGNTHKDWTPDVDSTGHVTNWERFDKNLGQLLDGSLFKDNPRKNIPVASFYLPFYEGFPLDYKKYYKSHPKAPMLPTKKVRQMEKYKKLDYVLRHNVLDDIPEKAFSPKYSAAYIKCVSEFYDHFKSKGWNKSVAQFYLNNKPKYGYSLWTLDEPNIYRDWQALNYFATLWKKGINDPYVYTQKGLTEIYEKGLVRKKPTFLFRGDISRFTWQGSVSDDLMNIVYVGGGGFDKARLIRNHKKRMPTILYAYGSCSSHKLNNWANAAWCIKSFVFESDGVLPWQSLGKGLNNPDPSGHGNGLIVNAPGYGDAIASFRVHALRRGAQDAELLRLVQLKHKISRAHIGLMISKFVSLAGDYKQSSVDEAAAQKFGKLNSRNFINLKESILMLLDKKY